LAPEVTGPAKAICLVVVVVRRRETLYAVRDRRIGDTVPVLDARRAEVDIVPGVGFLDADMVRDPQAELVRFVFHGLHDVAVDAEDLDPVGAHVLELAHARARRLRAGRPPELRINEHARRGD